MSLLLRAFTLLPIALPAYLIRFSIGPFPTTLLELLLLTLIGAWMIMRGRQGFNDAWEQTAAWRIPLLLWLIAGAISVAISPIPLQALGLYRAYFIEPLLLFFIGADLMRTQEQRTRLWNSFCAITIALAAYAAFQLATGFGIPHPWDAWPGRRSTGPFPYPNALALFVTPVAALALSKLSASSFPRSASTKRLTISDLRQTILHVATAIAGFVAILCAQSDGGLVALLAAIGLILLRQPATRKIAIVGAVIGLVGILAIPPVRTHVSKIVLFKDWSGMVRTVMWKETVTMLKDRPLLGAGLAAYPVAIKPYHKATWMEIFQYPHNIILNLWSETGVLGIVAFTLIVTTWIRQSHQLTMEQWNNRSRAPLLHDSIAIPVLTAILVHGLVDVPYFKNDLAVAWWLLILMTVATVRVQQSSR